MTSIFTITSAYLLNRLLLDLCQLHVTQTSYRVRRISVVKVHVVRYKALPHAKIFDRRTKILVFVLWTTVPQQLEFLVQTKHSVKCCTTLTTTNEIRRLSSGGE